MTPLPAAEAALQPIVTDADVEGRVDALIGHACRRSLWLLFTDSDEIQLRTLVPIEDYPTSPVDGHAAVLASIIKRVMDGAGAAQVIVVWERRASERFTPADRAWARAMALACGDAEVSIRAQLISHRTGVRWFPQDEFG